MSVAKEQREKLEKSARVYECIAGVFYVSDP